MERVANTLQKSLESMQDSEADEDLVNTNPEGKTLYVDVEKNGEEDPGESSSLTSSVQEELDEKERKKITFDKQLKLRLGKLGKNP